MKQKTLIFAALLALASFKAVAQDAGIHFMRALSWQQVLDSAKAEHKPVFVDCYTTWCGSCKMMEQQVYPTKEVGDVYNKAFICIKLQMDKDMVKNWQATADRFQKEYNINAYPSFLFFDEQGNAVHKAIGSLGAADFIKLAATARDTTKQLYRLLAAYEHQTIGYPGLATLADEAEEPFASEAAKAYIRDYLDHLSDSALVSPKNQAFLRRHAGVVTTGDRIFKLCLSSPQLVDGDCPGGAFYFACFIINKEIIAPMLVHTPDWKRIESTVITTYGSRYAADNTFLLDDQIDWYKYKKNGSAYAHYLAIKTEKSFRQSKMTMQQSSLYNNSAFDIFKYDLQKAELEQALHWMEKVNRLQPAPDASFLDTQTGLLYKLGRKTAALQLEKSALALANGDADIQSNYKKMLAGNATWPAENTCNE